MFNNVNVKALCIGFILLIVDIFIVLQKMSYLYTDSKHHRVVSGLDDTLIGYTFYFILFIISLLIINYSLSLNNKFTKFGRYSYELIRDVILEWLGKTKNLEIKK